MDTDIPATVDKASLQAFSVRLRDALENESITWLQEQLEGDGVEGSKYSNVQRYVAGNGKSPPSPTWLQGAAKVLDVRPGWLAFGDGERTEPEELKRVLRARAMKRAEEFGEDTEAALRKGLGRDPLPNYFDTALRCTYEYFTTVAPVMKIGPDLAREVGKAIAAPIRTLGLDPANFTQENYDHYVAAVAESLRFLIAKMSDPKGEED